MNEIRKMTLSVGKSIRKDVSDKARPDIEYNNIETVDTNEALQEVAKYDHVPGILRNGYRNDDSIICADCIFMDCDNTDSDSPEEWLTPEKVHNHLQNVAFYSVTSRSHNKVKHPGRKDESSARPRYHYYFPLAYEEHDVDNIRNIKKSIFNIFPKMDGAALPASQCFFGHPNPIVTYYSGSIDIRQYLIDTDQLLSEHSSEHVQHVTNHNASGSSSQTDQEFIDASIDMILEAIPADDEKTWSEVAVCLYRTGNGSDAYFNKFEQYSMKSHKYRGTVDCYKKWKAKQKQIDRSSHLDFSYLIHLAEMEDNSIKGKLSEIGKELSKKARESLSVHLAKDIKNDDADTWEHIETYEKRPDFPLDVFPSWINQLICDYAQSTGISKDYCASAVIGTISAAIVGHCELPFNYSHKEQGQLYTVFVGSSGTMKSSAIRYFAHPINRWLEQKNNIVKRENAVIEKQVKALETELNTLKKSKSKQTALQDKAREIEDKVSTRLHEYPVCIGDATTEALILGMKKTNGVTNIMSSEGNFINVLVGKSYTQQGSVPNIDIIMFGFDGDPFHNYRVTSGEASFDRVDISMLIAAQPGVLHSLCNSAISKDRGLIQRFLIYNPEKSNIAIDHTKPVIPSSDLYNKWCKHVESIANIFMRPGEKPLKMILSDDADMIIRSFWNEESQLCEEYSHDGDAIVGWLSKMHGKAIRVSAILALLENSDASQISGACAQKAVDLFKHYYIPHYIGAFMTACPYTEPQLRIISWIKRRSEDKGIFDQVTRTELYNDLRQRAIFKGKTGSQKLNDTLLELQNLSILKVTKDEPKGGRPCEIIKINPEFWQTKF